MRPLFLANMDKLATFLSCGLSWMGLDWIKRFGDRSKSYLFARGGIISQIWAAQRNTIYLSNYLYQLQIAKTIILSSPTTKLALYKPSLACRTFISILLHRSHHLPFLSLIYFTTMGTFWSIIFFISGFWS